MRPIRALSWGSLIVGFAALAVMAAVTLPLGAGRVSGAAVTEMEKSSAAAPLVAHPSATSNTSASVIVWNVLPTYTVLPQGGAPVDFFLVVANASISPANVTLWANVTDTVSHVVCQNVSLETLVAPTNLTNVSYSFNVSSDLLGNLTTLEATCPAVASDPVAVVISARVDGTAAPINGTVVTATSDDTGTTPSTSLIFALPTESLSFSTTPTLHTYNFSATYTGQYVGRVQLTVYSAVVVGGTRSIVLAASLLTTGSTPTVAAWYEPYGGNYPYTLQLFTPYANVSSSGIIALTNASSIYYNTTSQTVQGFGGMDPAVSGTVLLLVGFVVGALATFGASLLMRRPGAAAPQAWEAKGGAAGATTCSVCGRSFASADELASHRKSEHGME